MMRDYEHASKTSAIGIVSFALILVALCFVVFSEHVGVFFFIELPITLFILYQIAYGFTIFECTNKDICSSKDDYVNWEYGLYKFFAIIFYINSIILLLFHKPILFCTSIILTYICFWLTNWYTIRYQKKASSQIEIPPEKKEKIIANTEKIKYFRDHENASSCLLYTILLAIILLIVYADNTILNNCHITELNILINGKPITINHCFLLFPSANEGILSMLAGVAIAHTFLSTKKFADYFSTTKTS